MPTRKAGAAARLRGVARHLQASPCSGAAAATVEELRALYGPRDALVPAAADIQLSDKEMEALRRAAN